MYNWNAIMPSPWNHMNANMLFFGPLLHHVCLNCVPSHIDGLVQERRNSIANALELGLSYTNPWYVVGKQPRKI